VRQNIIYLILYMNSYQCKIDEDWWGVEGGTHNPITIHLRLPSTNNTHPLPIFAPHSYRYIYAVEEQVM
jgi:hypothetical protein